MRFGFSFECRLLFSEHALHFGSNFRLASRRIVA
jgi:hypothetical protein